MYISIPYAYKFRIQFFRIHQPPLYSWHPCFLCNVSTVYLFAIHENEPREASSLGCLK